MLDSQIHGLQGDPQSWNWGTTQYHEVFLYKTLNNIFRRHVKNLVYLCFITLNCTSHTHSFTPYFSDSKTASDAA